MTFTSSRPVYPGGLPAVSLSDDFVLRETNRATLIRPPHHAENVRGYMGGYTDIIVDRDILNRI